MKILYVTHQFFPRHVTGTETYTYELAREMRGRGHDVEILCYEHSTFDGVPKRGILTDEYKGFKVTRFCYDSENWPEPALYEYFNPEFGEMSLEFFNQCGPDLIHFTHNSFLSTALIDSARALNIPTALTLTDFWYLCPRMQLVCGDGTQCDGPGDDLRCLDCHYLSSGSDLTKPLRDILPRPLKNLAERARNALRKKIILALKGKDRFIKAVADRPAFLKSKMQMVDIVIVATKYLRDIFIEAGYEANRLRLINFGINTGLYEGLQKSPSEKLRVGFVGTLCEHKGAHVLLKAIKKIRRDDIEIAIYGNKTQFPAYARRLREIAEDDGRIKFCGTFPREDIGRVLATIDVLVIPSMWHENSPLILLYALGSRTPVIASNSGGLTEFIDDGKNGLLFERGDSAELAGHIERLANDRKLLRKLAGTPVRVMGIVAHADKIEDVYRELLQE